MKLWRLNNSWKCSMILSSAKLQNPSNSKKLIFDPHCSNDIYSIKCSNFKMVFKVNSSQQFGSYLLTTQICLEVKYLVFEKRFKNSKMTELLGDSLRQRIGEGRISLNWNTDLIIVNPLLDIGTTN